MIRLLLIKLLNRLLFRQFQFEYSIADRAAVESFLYECYGRKGAMDYLKVEELKVLKNLARGLTQENYWKEVGKREQLAMIASDIQRVFELRKAADAKKAAKEFHKDSNNENN